MRKEHNEVKKVIKTETYYRKNGEVSKQIVTEATTTAEPAEAPKKGRKWWKAIGRKVLAGIGLILYWAATNPEKVLNLIDAALRATGNQ